MSCRPAQTNLQQLDCDEIVAWLQRTAAESLRFELASRHGFIIEVSEQVNVRKERGVIIGYDLCTDTEY